MSDQTQYGSIPTVYRNVRLRSRLEADVAFLLDAMALRWEYEPQSFLLADGTHYLPDFRCSEARLWVEARGYRTDKGEAQIEGFARLIGEGTDYLVISPEGCRFWDGRGFGYWYNEAQIVACPSCRRSCFVSTSGWWGCRRCTDQRAARNGQLWDLEFRDNRLCGVDELGAPWDLQSLAKLLAPTLAVVREPSTEPVRGFATAGEIVIALRDQRSGFGSSLRKSELPPPPPSDRDAAS